MSYPPGLAYSSAVVVVASRKPTFDKIVPKYKAYYRQKVLCNPTVKFFILKFSTAHGCRLLQWLNKKTDTSVNNMIQNFKSRIDNQ